MLLSAMTIVSILAGTILAAFPSGNSTPQPSIDELVERGVASVATTNIAPTAMPTADAREFPEFNVSPAADVQNQLSALNSVVAGAKAADDTDDVDYGWLFAIYGEDLAMAADPDWFAGVNGADGERWVYAGVWYRCVAVNRLQYLAGGAGAKYWPMLTEHNQDNIHITCHGFSAIAPNPTPLPPADRSRSPVVMNLATVQSMTEAEHNAAITAAMNNPAWLSVLWNRNFEKSVFVGGWIACQHINQDWTYHTTAGDPVLDVWNGLSMEDKGAVIGACSP